MKRKYRWSSLEAKRTTYSVCNAVERTEKSLHQKPHDVSVVQDETERGEQRRANLCGKLVLDVCCRLDAPGTSPTKVQHGLREAVAEVTYGEAEYEEDIHPWVRHSGGRAGSTAGRI